MWKSENCIKQSRVSCSKLSICFTCLGMRLVAIHFVQKKPRSKLIYDWSIDNWPFVFITQTYKCVRLGSCFKRMFLLSLQSTPKGTEGSRSRNQAFFPSSEPLPSFPSSSAESDTSPHRHLPPFLSGKIAPSNPLPSATKLPGESRRDEAKVSTSPIPVSPSGRPSPLPAPIESPRTPASTVDSSSSMLLFADRRWQPTAGGHPENGQLSPSCNSPTQPSFGSSDQAHASPLASPAAPFSPLHDREFLSAWLKRQTLGFFQVVVPERS